MKLHFIFDNGIGACREIWNVHCRKFTFYLMIPKKTIASYYEPSLAFRLHFETRPRAENSL